MRKVEIHTEFIKLGQLLKLAGFLSQGSDIKFLIEDGKVFVNGEAATQRGKKICHGDVVSLDGETIEVAFVQ